MQRERGIRDHGALSRSNAAVRGARVYLNSKANHKKDKVDRVYAPAPSAAMLPLRRPTSSIVLIG